MGDKIDKNLRESDLAFIDKLSKSIDIKDTQSILEYGLLEQRNLADFASSVLAQMRSTKTGDIDFPLSELLLNVKSFDLNDIKISDKSPYKKFLKKAKKVLMRYQKTDRQIYNSEVKLEEARNQLLRDIVLLGKMEDKNKEHKAALERYIIAAEQHVKNLEKNKKLKSNKQNVNSDLKSINRLRDLANRIKRLEKRIYDLKLSRMMSIQMIPQIQLMQNANQTLVEKIQTSLLTTIPLWRNQMVIAIALLKQKSAMKMQREFIDKANKELNENAKDLNLSIKDAKSNLTSGAEEIEKLKQTSKNLIDIIVECQKTLRNGEESIKKVRSEILKIKKDIDKNE